MKKKIILSAVLLFGLILPSCAEDKALNPQTEPKMEIGINGHTFDAKERQKHMAKRAEFEKRLNLTEEQKIKAKEIRAKGRGEMIPLMDAMKAKRKEMEALKAKNAQYSEFEKVQKDMKELRKKIHEARIANMKEFEAILTPKQQKELKKMKEEGRKNFEKRHNKNCACNKDKNFSPMPECGLLPAPKKLETK